MRHPSPKQLFYFFARMPEPLQQEVLEKTFERYYLLRKREKQAPNRSSLYRQALLFILRSYYDQLHVGSAKKYTKELESLREKSNLQLAMKTLTRKFYTTKAIKLLNKFAPSIYELKEHKQASYQEICTHLAKYHKLKVDRSYLCKLYPMIKQGVEDLKYIHSVTEPMSL